MKGKETILQFIGQKTSRNGYSAETSEPSPELQGNQHKVQSFRWCSHTHCPSCQAAAAESPSALPTSNIHPLESALVLVQSCYPPAQHLPNLALSQCLQLLGGIPARSFLWRQANDWRLQLQAAWPCRLASRPQTIAIRISVCVHIAICTHSMCIHVLVCVWWYYVCACKFHQMYNIYIYTHAYLLIYSLMH